MQPSLSTLGPPGIIPTPVMTQTRNDCGICAVKYVASLFGISAKREDIMQTTGWDSETGGLPLSYLHKHGLRTPGWVCEGLDRVPDPERPGVKITPATPANIDTLWEAYRHQIADGHPGIVIWMLHEGPHAEVIIGAYEHDGQKMILLADSLAGVKEWSAEYAFTGTGGGMRGMCVWWVSEERPEDAIAIGEAVVTVRPADRPYHNKVGVVAGTMWGRYVVNFEGGPMVEDFGLFGRRELKRWSERFSNAQAGEASPSR